MSISIVAMHYFEHYYLISVYVCVCVCNLK